MNYQPRPLSNIDLQNKILLIKDYFLANLNAPISERLFRAIGGVGCSPNSSKQLISTINIITEEPMVWMRSNFEGWYTEQEVEELLNHERLVD